MDNPVLQKIQAELEAFAAKRKLLIEELRTEFPNIILPLFEKHKDTGITSFGWTQYTPYFNDGETCEFSVHADYPYINGDYIDEHPLHEYGVDYAIRAQAEGKLNTHYPIEKYNEEQIRFATAVMEFKQVINLLPEDFLQDIFDDHSKVTVYSDGTIEVTEYDHD